MSQTPVESTDALQAQLAESRAREADARAFQAAISDVLQAMARWPGESARLFELLLDHALATSGALFVFVGRFDGELLHPIANRGLTPEELENSHAFAVITRPHRPDRSTLLGTSVLERRVLQVENADNAPRPDTDADLRRKLVSRSKSAIAFPLLSEHGCSGAFSLGFATTGPVPEPTVDFLQALAHQAALIIENARLFRETQEALERQTATAEVLQVISRSPTDVQPVFDAIAERAAALCHAGVGTTSVYDGELIHMVAVSGASLEQESIIKGHFPRPADDSSFNGRAVLTRAPVHIADALEDPTHPQTSRAAQSGVRSLIAVPMIRDQVVVGVIAVTREQPGLFSEPQVQLLQTFADQAVIAVENARLFRETQEALEHLTASAEILQVISSSPTSTQPVFEAIAERARAVSGWDFCVISSFDGEWRHFEAATGLPEDEYRFLQSMSPSRLSRATAAGRAILTGELVNIADVAADPEFQYPQLSRRYGSVVGVPLVRNRRAIGALSIGRQERGGAPDKLVRLLQTFADQAVIAIENVSLLKSTQEALEHQTATAEVLRVISSSVADTRPVFERILDSCQALLAVNQMSIVLVDDEGQARWGAWRGDLMDAARNALPPLYESKKPVLDG